MKTLIITLILLVPLLSIGASGPGLLLITAEKRFSSVINDDISNLVAVIGHSKSVYVNTVVEINKQPFEKILQELNGYSATSKTKIRLPFSGVEIPTSNSDYGSNVPSFNDGAAAIDERSIELFSGSIKKISVDIETSSTLTDEHLKWIKGKVAKKYSVPEARIELLHRKIGLDSLDSIDSDEINLSWFSQMTGWNLTPEEVAGLLIAITLLITSLLRNKSKNQNTAETTSTVAEPLMTQTKTLATSSPRDMTLDEYSWDKANLAELKLFVHDCEHKRETRDFPPTLLGRMLTHEQSNKLLMSLPSRYRGAIWTHAEMINPREVAVSFQQHLPAYRSLSQSPTANQLCEIGNSKIIEFVESSKIKHRSVILTELTPMRFEAILEGIKIQDRIALSEDLKSLKDLRIDELQKLKNSICTEICADVEDQGEKGFVFDYFSAKISEPKNFQEEEDLLKSPASREPYFLLSDKLFLLTDLELNQLSINRLSLVTFGYSANFRERVEARLSPTERKWYADLCLQHLRNGLQYQSVEVKAMREFILDILKSKKEE